jgi:hypothetical protein
MMIEGTMFDHTRQPWTNDQGNLTRVVVVIAVLAAMSFVVAQGWLW